MPDRMMTYSLVQLVRSFISNYWDGLKCNWLNMSHITDRKYSYFYWINLIYEYILRLSDILIWCINMGSFCSEATSCYISYHETIKQLILKFCSAIFKVINRDIEMFHICRDTSSRIVVSRFHRLNQNLANTILPGQVLTL